MDWLLAFHPLRSIQHLSGDLLVAVIAALMFIEESGVPVPFAPGDLLLLIGGVAIASDSVEPEIFLLAVIAATTLGALLGREIFALVGRPTLMKAASAVGFRGALDRATHLMERGGARAVFLGRLIPGLRIHTTQVAGVTGLPRLTFLTGLLPSVVVYVAVFTGAGALVGRPVVGVFHRAEHRLFGLGLSALLACAFVLSVTVLARRGAFDPLEPIVVGVRRELADALESRLLGPAGSVTPYPLVRRLWAGLADLLLILGVSTFLLAAIAGAKNTEEVLDLPGLLVIIGVTLAYRIPLEARTGQTLGKRIMGVSVFDHRGKPPGVWRAALRNVLGVFAILWPVDAVLLLRDGERRRVGDRLSRTTVRHVSY